MASLLNMIGGALIGMFISRQDVHLSFASATVNALTTDGTKAVQLVTSDVQGLTYTYSSSDTNVASISGSTITIHKSGSVTITASFAGDEIYKPASASYSLMISKADVTLSFTNATVNEFATTSTTQVQTVNSSVQGLQITYSSSNSEVATITGTVITIHGVGSTVITASFAGNEIYNSSYAVYTMSVSKANVTLSFSSATINTTTTVASMQVQSVTSSVQGLTVTYSSSDASVATISGTTITIVGAGTTTITATFAGNESYNPASASYTLAVAKIYNFAYTGAVQNQVLEAGTYKLEVWGAQGGSYSSTAGGKGGYSVGTITIPSQTTVYVYVGGQGAGANSATALTGGFNGGGNGYSGASYYFGSGGGASDIRIGQDSLYARVIVAGGGGGVGSQSTSSSRRYAGGYGGGTSGGQGSQRSNSYRAGTGGSATAAGTSYSGTTADPTNYNASLAGFGVGGGRTSGTNRTAGGGGGWYGGGFSASGGGGGGSGYVYTSSTKSNYPSGKLITDDSLLTNTTITAGNGSIPKTDGSGNETGHTGNGYARITKI